MSLPFSDHCEPLLAEHEDLDAMLDLLRSDVKYRNDSYIELRPVVCKPGERGAFTICNRYISHGIDLSGSCDAQFRTFHKSCVQRKIRRAERESLAYEVGNSEQLLATFFRLHTMTRRRQGLPPQPMRWFRALGETFGDSLQVRLASKAGRPIASIVTLKFGSTITYKYGCSDHRFSSLGGTALLFWRTIQECFRENIRYFDLGRCSIEHEGLIRFKEHLGAQSRALAYWRYPGHSLHGRATPAKKLVLVSGYCSGLVFNSRWQAHLSPHRLSGIPIVHAKPRMNRSRPNRNKHIFLRDAGRVMGIGPEHMELREYGIVSQISGSRLAIRVFSQIVCRSNILICTTLKIRPPLDTHCFGISRLPTKIEQIARRTSGRFEGFSLVDQLAWRLLYGRGYRVRGCAATPGDRRRGSHTCRFARDCG